MTDAERIKTERRIEALLTELFLLRCRLEIDRREAAGEALTPAWGVAKQILTDRRDLAAAMADACDGGK